MKGIAVAGVIAVGGGTYLYFAHKNEWWPFKSPGPGPGPGPGPSSIDIINASFNPTYPVYGQGGSATLTLRNSGGQDVNVVVIGKVFRAGTDCPVQGSFQQISARITAGQTVAVNVPYAGGFTYAKNIDWSSNEKTCWQTGTKYGWLDCYFEVSYLSDKKSYTLKDAIKLP